MADLTAMLQAAAGQAGEDTDPFFNQTTLLLHGDGTNGAQNNTFLDSSTNNFTITRNGNTTQGTFSPFSLAAGEFSNFFTGVGSGSGRYGALITTTSSDFGYGTGDFTIEGWFYITGTLANNPCVISTQAGGSAALRFNSNNTVDFFIPNVGNAIVSDTFTLPLNEWFHFAGVRASNSDTFYLNGVAQGSSKTDNNNYANPTSEIVIGQTGTNGPSFPGYISNFRVVKGTAVYTGTFTPSTTPLTAISGTSLLTCQDNRFKDNSTNNFAISPGAANSVQPFSPFLPSAAYSPSVNGGSGYFGTGNYLTAPDDNAWDLTASTGSIEMFLYSTTTQTNGNGLVGQNSATGDWGGYVYADGKIAIGIQGSSELATAAGNLVNNTWIHVVFTRDNSTGRTRTFVNGVLKATGTGTYFAVSSNPLQIINFNDGVNRSFIGYVADIRFCKGSIPTDYQTASTTVDASIFTPPTAPLTASSQGATSADTELLLNFTNAGIFDNTGKNNLETVGNAQIDTSVKKYGTGSMEFDGTGDYLSVSGTSDLFVFGTGDFTIECWVYLNSTTGYQSIYDQRPSGSATALTPAIYLDDTSLKYYVNGADRITAGTALSTGTWYHIAVSRSGTSTKMFLDGTQTGSTYTDSNNYINGANRPVLAVDGSNTANNELNGYIDDLRITKGVARYTTTFTPPTAAFPDL